MEFGLALERIDADGKVAVLTAAAEEDGTRVISKDKILAAAR